MAVAEQLRSLAAELEATLKVVVRIAAYYDAFLDKPVSKEKSVEAAIIPERHLREFLHMPRNGILQDQSVFREHAGSEALACGCPQENGPGLERHL